MINLKDYNIINPVESLTEYGDGGLCPIHINDRFQDGRYEILNKLGFGGFSTVWAAQDHRSDTEVSIKVIRAEHSENNKELRILQFIQENTTQHPGHKYLPKLLDYFYQDGPGGKNLFLVLELLGPPASILFRYLPKSSISSCRQISRQLLLAIDCLHSHGIVHGDINANNILFRLPDDFELDLDDVKKGEVSRKDGAPLEKGIPRYLVEPIKMEWEFDHDDLEELDHIQLIDFSSSFFDSESPNSISTPAVLSPPELIFRKSLTKSVDIWNFACITYYLATGQWLFWSLGGSNRNIIPQIHRTIGESSAHWLLTAFLDAIYDVSNFYDYHILERTLQDDTNDMPDAEKKQIGALTRFLRKALVADPLERATTKELQAEEWYQMVTH
ncbi:kinase-like protein [Melanomma pulvis-pyrius CBS 109.77]|uniref:non-specific serine/threonine protein kinase n=1 Tax=Melanomma pulvis-pyrius CBS 109.77 TaxID=1314802 RepID=A0A6A6XGX7_9PLEO|nr:kinase-like protein [Melanomma pulvis-pyrius CBS 109.77]